MKPQIIPAILAESKKEFFTKMDVAAQFASTVQIDIMDGLFVKNKTPRDLNSGKWFADYLMRMSDSGLLDTDIPVPDIELHLMVMDPWKVIRQWHEFEQLKRAIWHFEAPIEHSELVEIVDGLGIVPGLAINPKTKATELVPYLAKKDNITTPDHILVMGVNPGWSGQKFLPVVLPKIRTLRKKFPKLSIGVDGGMNLKTAASVVKSGANVINAAGSIFLAQDPQVAYHQLAKIAGRQ